MRVLVIDDDEDFRSLVLRWFGNIVLVAEPHDPAQVPGRPP